MNQTKLWVFRGMLMLASLFAVKANAVNIPIISTTSTTPKTATASCVVGYYAAGWNVSGNYFQYALNTSGYSGAVTMDFSTQRSSTGPTTVQIIYIINNGTPVALPAGQGGIFTVGTGCATKIATLPAACAGVADLKVRLMPIAPLPTNAAGTFRVDSVNVFDAASGGCTSVTGGTANGPGSVCAGSSANLTLTGSSAGTGITYQWQSSPTGSTWTDIVGATSLSYTTPVLSTTTHYRAVVTCAGFGSANSTATIVTVNTVSVAAITGYTAPLLVGATQTLANTTPGGVWSSSNTSAASVDLITGSLVGEFGGSSTITYSVFDAGTGCTGTSTVNVNVVWPNTLALYAGQNGTSTSVINVPGDVVSSLYAVGFGGATACGSGGLSGITVPVADSTFDITNPHVGYRVYANAGKVLNMFRIHARARVSSTGPTKARIAYQYWSSNGTPSGWQVEPTAVDLVDGSCGASANSWDFNSGIPANPNPTVNGMDSLEVAVFPYAPGASTGTFQLNTLEVYGIVTSDSQCNAGSIATTADSVLPAVVNICDSGARFLNYNVGNGGLAGVNIIYQWQRSTNGTTWSDIVDANGVVYQTPNFHAGVDPDTNYYRVVITCDASGDTSHSAINVVTVNPTPANAGTISGALAPSVAFPMKHMLIGTTYAMTSTIAGGTWSSNDTSSISFGGTSTATPNLPGDAIITYRTSVGGCTGTSKDTVAAYHPGTKVLYIGKGGNSTAVYAATGTTATALATANWGSSTACGSGGISGLTNTTTVQDQATNGRVSTIVAGSTFLASSVRATLRKTNSGTYKAYLGYRPAAGGAWTLVSAPVDVETDDCGYSHNELIFPVSVTVAGAGTEFAVFGYNGTATTTLQVNTISVLGSGTQLMKGTGISDLENNANVQLFPNPTTNVLNVTASEKVNVVIMSIDGKKLIEQKDASRIDVSSLVSGMYLIQVYGENNSLLKAEKFVKK
ncbi:MAG: T9SS type A sorting domain-containing protein [Taibaiella sp.]